jgi:hypothetical protein
LSTWEQAAEAVLDFKQPGMVAADKGKPPRRTSDYYYTNFTATMVSPPAGFIGCSSCDLRPLMIGARIAFQQEDYIADAKDINESDIDFVDVDGTVYITYSWGDQQGTEFLGAAIVRNATSDQWLMSYF